MKKLIHFTNSKGERVGLPEDTTIAQLIKAGIKVDISPDAKPTETVYVHDPSCDDAHPNH